MLISKNNKDDNGKDNENLEDNEEFSIDKDNDVVLMETDKYKVVLNMDFLDK